MRIYTTGRGYEEFRRPGREGVNDAVKHHRVLAYAWGLLDGLDDPREIDHLGMTDGDGEPIPWLNIRGNLEAVEPDDHGRRTRRRAAERKARAATSTA